MDRKIKYLLIYLSSFVLIGIIPDLNAGNPLILTDDKDRHRMGSWVEYLEDREGKLTINDIRTDTYQNKFIPSDSEIPSFGYTRSVYWIRFDVINHASSRSPWTLELEYPKMDFADLYVFLDDSLKSEIHTGVLRPIRNREHFYHHLVFFIPLVKDQKHTVYIRFKNEASMTLPLTLWSMTAFMHQSYLTNLWMGIFAGIMIIIIAYTLFLAYSLKDKSYFYFSLLILAIFLFLVSFSGMGNIYLWPDVLWLNRISNPLLIMFICLTFIKFSDSFLLTKIQMNKWHRIDNYMLLISAGILLFIPFFQYGIMIIPILVYILLILSYITILSFIALKKGYRPAGAFLLSNFIMLITIFMILLARLGIFESNFYTENSFIYGSILLVVLMYIALTDRINLLKMEKDIADRNLAQSEQRFRGIIETTNDFIWEVDSEGKYTYVSPQSKQLLGYDQNEMLGKRPFDFMPKRGSIKIEKLFFKLATAKKPIVQLENITRKKNGEEVFLETSGVPFLDHEGNLLGYRGIDRDITERKTVAESLRRSESNLRALLNATTDVAFLIDREYKIIALNQSFCTIVGRKMDDLVGADALSLIPPDLAKSRKIKLDEAFKTGKPIRWEDQGAFSWSDNSVYPISDETGEVTSVAIFSLDVSERKRAESLQQVIYTIADAVSNTKDIQELYSVIHRELNKLIDATNFFVGLYDTESDMITLPYMKDEKDQVEKAPAAQTISAQVIKNNQSMLLKQDDMNKLQEEGKIGTVGSPCKIWLGVPLRDENEVIGIIVVQSYTDENAFNQSDLELLEFISQQVASAIKRKQNEGQIRILSRSVEQSPAIVLITDLEGNIEYVNPKFIDITGYSGDEVIGKNPRFLKSGKTPKETYITLWETIKAGKEWRGEFLNKKKNGDLYWEFAHISPIKNDQGLITHFLAIQEDITERKRLEKQLITSQKMEAIGTLAGGIAHDFNNLLTIINGYSDMALIKIDPSNPLKKELAAIREAGRKATDLTRQILAFSRKQIYQPQLISINHIISDLNKMIRRLIGEDIKIQMTLAADLSLIKADPGQIEQILINLVVNARDAINQKTNRKSDKKIIIKSEMVFLDAAFVTDHMGSQTGKHIHLSVHDNGAGMSEEVRQKIFEPFFTTKDEGKGTGLGLATVYGIVKQNNGSIYVNSEADKGTIFNIYWPAVAESGEVKPRQEESNQDLFGKEIILFVEDEREVLDFASNALEEFGYQVYSASNGFEALEIVKSKKYQFDLLVTDLVMPDMNGKDLSEKIYAYLPDVQVLFVSGYADDSIVNSGELEEDLNFLQKPYSVRNLLQKVRTILNGD